VPRIVSLPLIASIALCAFGCVRPNPPAPSAFAREAYMPRVFEGVAQQTGVKQAGFSWTGESSSMEGRSKGKGTVRYCARPEQIDEVMRVAHAEILKRVRDSGAEPRGDTPPNAPAAVKSWTITYAAGPQEGSIQITRNDGAAGSCQGEGVLEYALEVTFEEAPKPSR
jgi:hypothetical protein